jgi:hypothetical protein
MQHTDKTNTIINVLDSNLTDINTDNETLEKTLAKLQTLNVEWFDVYMAIQHYYFKDDTLNIHKLFMIVASYPSFLDMNVTYMYMSFEMALQQKLCDYYSYNRADFGKPFTWFIERIVDGNNSIDKIITDRLFNTIDWLIEWASQSQTPSTVLTDLNERLESYPRIFDRYLKRVIADLHPFAAPIKWDRLSFLLRTDRGSALISRVNYHQIMSNHADLAAKRLVSLKNKPAAQRRILSTSKRMSRDMGLPYETCVVKLISI